MENYNNYIISIYNNILNVSKLSLDDNKQNNLKKLIKQELSNFINKNYSIINTYNQDQIIHTISNIILNKLKKNNTNNIINNNINNNINNIYDNRKPINTRENFNIENFTNYKQQRNELYALKNPEEINFSDPLYKPKNKSTNNENITNDNNMMFNSNNNLNNYFSNINDIDNDDNKYKIDFSDNKNYEDEETLEQRLKKINQEREILNSNINPNPNPNENNQNMNNQNNNLNLNVIDKNNKLNNMNNLNMNNQNNNLNINMNNNFKNSNINNNNNKNMNNKQFNNNLIKDNNNDFNIDDIQEILILTTNKIQELTLLYNELNKKVDYLYNKK